MREVYESFTMEEINQEMSGTVEFLKENNLPLSGKAAMALLNLRLEHLAIERKEKKEK